MTHTTTSMVARRFLSAAVGILLALALVQPAVANRLVSGVTAQLHVADVQIREGKDAVFVLMLSRPLDFDIRYAYRTEDLSAKAGKDYVAENGFIVIPAGTRVMPLSIKTLKDNVIDKNRFKLVLSDFETHGYGKVWGQYIWTDWWHVEGLPLTVTANARIANSLDDARQRSRTGDSKYKRP